MSFFLFLLTFFTAFSYWAWLTDDLDHILALLDELQHNPTNAQRSHIIKLLRRYFLAHRQVCEDMITRNNILERRISELLVQLSPQLELRLIQTDRQTDRQTDN